MVGTAGLEPTTSRPPGERATRLRYAPNLTWYKLFFSRRQMLIRGGLACAANHCAQIFQLAQHIFEHGFLLRVQA